MWDFRLNNTCNHRIINEKLDIKGTYPNYYATLKRPVYGNNFKITILNQDNLFSINPIKIKYLLGEDSRTLKFNYEEIDVDVRSEVYPVNTYYATYTTSQEFCPKCIFGTNKTNDFYFNVLGKPNIITNLDYLVQKVKKILITELGSNVFDINYGSELPTLVGKPKTALTLLKTQSSISEAIQYIQNDQLTNASILNDSERLLKMDNFQIAPSDNPKNIQISFEIYTLSGQNINMGVTV